MSLTAGSKLGPYEILSPLGAGGMGEVFRARDTRLGRDVAVKIFPERFSGRPELRERFEREARTISALNHARICTIYDVGHQDEIQYLVMEFLEGETLAERIQKGPLPLREIVRIGMEICEALDAAHRAWIIHRDLKPANVMLTASGAKLMDFGLAKASAASASGNTTATTNAPLLSAAETISGPSPLSPLTSAGQVVGTIQYMSPEQIEGKEADARSDIFALGAVLYEMATGKRPFAGKSQISLATAILEKDPEPIRTLQPALPPALDRVVRTCLQKNPEDRFQSARDVRLEL
jgi:serine/threonine protein kinase